MFKAVLKVGVCEIASKAASYVDALKEQRKLLNGVEFSENFKFSCVIDLKNEMTFSNITTEAQLLILQTEQSPHAIAQNSTLNKQALYRCLNGQTKLNPTGLELLRQYVKKQKSSHTIKKT